VSTLSPTNSIIQFTKKKHVQRLNYFSKKNQLKNNKKNLARIYKNKKRILGDWHPTVFSFLDSGFAFQNACSPSVLFFGSACNLFPFLTSTVVVAYFTKKSWAAPLRQLSSLFYCVSRPLKATILRDKKLFQDNKNCCYKIVIKLVVGFQNSPWKKNWDRNVFPNEIRLIRLKILYLNVFFFSLEYTYKKSFQHCSSLY